MSGGGTNTIERESGPPAFQQPYIEDALSRARNQYLNYSPKFFPGTTVAGLPAPTVQGTDNMAAFNNSPYNQNILGTAAQNTQRLSSTMDPGANPLLAGGLALQPQSVGLLGDVQNRATGAEFDLGQRAQQFAGQYGNIGPGPGAAATGGAQDTLGRLQTQGTNVSVASTSPTAAEALGSTAGATNTALTQQLQAAPGANPFVDEMVQRALQQTTDSFQTNVLPAISNNSQMTGGFGGSRQAIAESNAANNLADAQADMVARMYSNQYNADAQRQLQAAGLGAQVAGQAGAQQLQRQGQEQNFGLAQAQLAQGDAARQLQAAGTAGQIGLGQDARDLQAGQLELSAAGLGAQVGANEYGLVSDAVGQGLQANQMANNMLESGYRTGVDSTIRNQALLPQTQGLGLAGPQAQLSAGDVMRQYEQQLIDEAVNRFNFNQAQPIDALNRYGNTVGLGNGLLGQSLQTEGPRSGGAVGAIGGAAAGAGIAGALTQAGMMTSGSPWGWALMGLGALGGYFA